MLHQNIWAVGAESRHSLRSAARSAMRRKPALQSRTSCSKLPFDAAVALQYYVFSEEVGRQSGRKSILEPQNGRVNAAHRL